MRVLHLAAAISQIIMTAALPSIAPAQEWRTIDSSAARRVRVNIDRLRHESPSVVEAWVEYSYPSEHPGLVPGILEDYSRLLEDSYFDCPRVQQMVLSEVYYHANGAGAGSRTPPSAQRIWRPAPPGSLAEFIEQQVCLLARNAP